MNGFPEQIRNPLFALNANLLIGIFQEKEVIKANKIYQPTSTPQDKI